MTRCLSVAPCRENAVVVVLASADARVEAMPASGVGRCTGGGGVDSPREIGDLVVHGLRSLPVAIRSRHEDGIADLRRSRGVDKLFDSARRASAAHEGRDADLKLSIIRIECLVYSVQDTYYIQQGIVGNMAIRKTCLVYIYGKIVNPKAVLPQLSIVQNAPSL